MKISEIIESFISGDWGNDSYEDATPMQVTCVRGADINSVNEGFYEEVPIRYISEASYRNKLLQEGDIIIEKSGGSPTQSTGRVALVSKQMIEEKGAIICSNFCCAFRVKKEWYPNYVYYYFKSVYNSDVFFNYEGKTSGIKNLQIDDAFEKIKIPNIEIAYQKKLVGILEEIDHKLYLNKMLNVKLTSLLQDIYDYWFVQFDFPNEEGKPYKTSGGEMVWNEKLKREIPKGWETINLFEGMNVQYGFPFSTELFTEDVTQKPIVRIRDILQGSISAYTVEDVEDRYRLKKGDILIGMDGNFHMNFWHNDISYLNQRSVRLRAIDDSNISAVQCFYEVKPYIKLKESSIKGSTVGHLLDKDLKQIYLLKPVTNNHFQPRESFDLYLKKMIMVRNEIKELTDLRDFLLPMLMNGQIKIKE